MVRFNPRLPGELALSALGGEQRGVQLLRGAWRCGEMQGDEREIQGDVGGIGGEQRGVELLRGAWLGLGPRLGSGLGLGLELEQGLKLQLGLGLGLRLRLGSGFERPCACGSARA